MVVDDSAFMRKMISDMINSSNEMEVIDTAKDGVEAIDKIMKLRPDVVTLDIEMPKKTGLEVLVYLKNIQGIKSKIIMLSSLTDKTADVLKGLIMGISEIKNVDITMPEIVRTLKEDNTTKETSKELNASKDNEVKNVKSTIANEKDKNKKCSQSVRVDLDRLDKFMNLVGELVIHRTRLEQLSNNHKLMDLHETLEQVGRITTDLQELVMKVRMLPIESVFNRFPRMIRDLAQELGKDIELVISGEDTELDRTVIDEIGEPLVHLIRNAADHGIEKPEDRIKAGKSAKGTIKLIAYQDGNKAVIKIEDDGKGIDVQKVKVKAESLGIDTSMMSEAEIKNLIFMQGFSTADKVSDISGRGVGMDVVKSKIASLGGTVEVVSEFGKGTSFIIKLPLTLSIIQALLVKVENETFAISLGFIDRVINVKTSDIKLTNAREVIIYRNNIIPVIRLANKLGLNEVESENKYIVIVKVGEKTAGLVVDSLLGQQEVVIKPIGKLLQNLKEYVGATILGDGIVTLILDIATLV